MKRLLHWYYVWQMNRWYKKAQLAASRDYGPSMHKADLYQRKAGI